MEYVKCPYCGATLSVPEEYKNDKHLHCSQCEKIFENLPKLKVQHQPSNPITRKRRKRNTEWTIRQKLGLCVFIFAVCNFLYHCGACEPSDSPKIGDRIIITTNTFGTIGEETSKELYRTIEADDAIGRYELVHDGKVQFIWQGASGKVTRRGWFQYQVRFDDGSLYWVPSDHVKKE